MEKLIDEKSVSVERRKPGRPKGSRNTKQAGTGKAAKGKRKNKASVNLCGNLDNKPDPVNLDMQPAAMAIHPDDNLVENQDPSVPVPVKKRGRPKGSKNTTIRKDHDIQAADPGKNSKMIKFSMAFYSLPKIDVNNIEQVKNRVIEFFSICASFDIKPTVAALAMAFHIDRMTLFNWLNNKSGTIKNTECLYTIKAAYNQINLLYETYLTDGSIIPVSAFFLMKNNLGYKDTTDFVVSTNNEKDMTLTDITNRAGLLD